MVGFARAHGPFRVVPIPTSGSGRNSYKQPNYCEPVIREVLGGLGFGVSYCPLPPQNIYSSRALLLPLSSSVYSHWLTSCFFVCFFSLFYFLSSGSFPTGHPACSDSALLLIIPVASLYPSPFYLLTAITTYTPPAGTYHTFFTHVYTHTQMQYIKKLSSETN